MWKIAVAALAGFGMGTLLIGTASVLAMSYVFDSYMESKDA
jgi:hypothetical protein